MKNMKGDMNMSLYMFPLIQVAKSPPAPAVRVSQYRGIRPKKFFWGRGGGLLTYTWMITEIHRPMLILSDDDMIYTYANM